VAATFSQGAAAKAEPASRFSAMPKKYRLSGEEIRHLSGKRMHGKLFSLLVAPISGTHAKFACVVSKKTAARAVDRNKIKRRCRSVLAAHAQSVQKPVALVFYAKSAVKEASFADTKRDIDQLLSKV
jgi:ribonuclease P protein component